MGLVTVFHDPTDDVPTAPEGDPVVRWPESGAPSESDSTVSSIPDESPHGDVAGAPEPPIEAPVEVAIPAEEPANG